jgi:uncharacterized protein YkwD
MTNLGKRPIRALLATAVLAISVTACFGSAPAPAPSCQRPGGPPDAVTAAVVNGTNTDRAAYDVAPREWNPQLWCLADDWSVHMASTGSLTHQDLGAVLNSPAYSGYTTLGENIIHGPGSMTGEQMEAAWMASPNHRANILSPAFRWIGVATARASDGSMYAAEEFGG